MPEKHRAAEEFERRAAADRLRPLPVPPDRISVTPPTIAALEPSPNSPDPISSVPPDEIVVVPESTAGPNLG